MSSRKYRRVQYIDTTPSVTKQSHKDECDVNKILERYKLTGHLTHVKNGGLYGDFSNIGSYKEAVDQVSSATESFMSLPASVRKRFDNDPGLFLDFTGDPKNLDEMKKLGLMKETSVDNKASPGTISDSSKSPDVKDDKGASVPSSKPS